MRREDQMVSVLLISLSKGQKKLVKDFLRELRQNDGYLEVFELQDVDQNNIEGNNFAEKLQTCVTKICNVFIFVCSDELKKVVDDNEFDIDNDIVKDAHVQSVIRDMCNSEDVHSNSICVKLKESSCEKPKRLIDAECYPDDDIATVCSKLHGMVSEAESNAARDGGKKKKKNGKECVIC